MLNPFIQAAIAEELVFQAKKKKIFKFFVFQEKQKT